MCMNKSVHTDFIVHAKVTIFLWAHWRCEGVYFLYAPKFLLKMHSVLMSQNILHLLKQQSHSALISLTCSTELKRCFTLSLKNALGQMKKKTTKIIATLNIQHKKHKK